MTKVAHALIVLFLGLSLLIGPAAAADPTWEIDRTYLIPLDEKNYSLTGTNLTLPVNLTNIGDEGNITRMVITATVTNSEDDPVLGLDYDYKSGIKGLKEQQNNQKWIYAIAGADIDADMTPAFTLNITGLPYDVDPYTVNLSISFGRGPNPSKDGNCEQSLNIINWLKVDTETWDNTLETCPEVDKWNYTIPAEVRYIIIPNPIPNSPGNEEYESDVPFPTIARYNESGTYTLETYPFALLLNPDNCSIIVNKSYEDDKTNWIAVQGTSIGKGSNENVSLSITQDDANAKWFKVSFIGNNLGDVTDLDGDAGIITDVDYIFHTMVHLTTNWIDSERMIYGDIDGNGVLDLDDAKALIGYWKTIVI